MSNPLRFSEFDYKIFIFTLTEQTDRPFSPVVMKFEDNYYEVMIDVAPKYAPENPIIQYEGEDHSEIWFKVTERDDEKHYIEIIVNKMPLPCELEENSVILGNTYTPDDETNDYDTSDEEDDMECSGESEYNE